MIRINKGLLWLPFLFLFSCVYGQMETVRGVVYDSLGEKVQFAYVFVNQDSANSTFSDIDGRFQISSNVPINTLTAFHPAYKPLSITSPITTDSLIVSLGSELDVERVYTSDVNAPVFRIINHAVILEHTNDPEQLGGSFSYKTYNKTVVDLYQLKDHKIPDKYGNSVEKDTLFIKHHRIHGHEHLDIIESVNERVFKYPNKNYERVVALKHTGNDKVRAAPIYSNQHPISFYNNYFDFLDIRYATPLGNRTHKHYEFKLEAILPHQNDTVFVIHFRPHHLRLPGLEGTMYINSNNYAIQNIVARPTEHKLIDFQISENFEFIENKEWFPRQINYVYLLKKSPKKYLGTINDKKTYILNINLDPDLSKDQGSELCVCEAYANYQSEDFWRLHRIEPLTQKQKRTYLRVDTLRHQSVPAIILQRMVGFYRNKLTYKLPFMQVGNVFQLNRFEGARFGLKGWAGRDLLQFVEFSGYGAYGIRDNQWKWGAQVGLFLSKNDNVELKYEHAFDIYEPGSVEFLDQKPDFFRKIFTSRMDKYISNKISLRFRTPGYHLAEFGFNNYYRESLYDYQFLDETPNGDVLNNSFNATEFSFRMRYAIKEKITRTLGQVSRLESHYPIFYLNYTQGVSGIMDGSIDFYKFVAHMDYKFRVGHIGTTKLNLEGGTMSSLVPYPLLFNGRGGNLATRSIIIQNHFQTMGIYEFTSNKYFNLFFQHNFGSRIFAKSKFKPDFIVYQHMGWGDLENAQLHTGSDAVTKNYNSGYFESGVGLNNFIKFKLFGKVYGALGLGYFYRYGPERNPGGFGENSALRVTYGIKLL